MELLCVEEKDFSELTAMIMEAWPEVLNASEPEKVRTARAATYLQHNLLHADFALKAVEQDVIAGFIIGRTEGDERVFPEEMTRARMHQAMSITGEKKEIPDEEDPLKKGMSPDHDSEVMLLIVSPSFQGRGIGRKLVEAYVDFCTEKGRKAVYLVTDTLCGFGFYEKLGFRKEGEDHKKFGPHMNNVEVDSYLYAIRLPAGREHD